MIIKFTGTIKSAFLTWLLGWFSVLLSFFVHTAHHSVCAAPNAGCIHHHKPLVRQGSSAECSAEVTEEQKAYTETKLEFWGLRALTPTTGSTCGVWGSTAEILIIKTVLVNQKLGFSLRSQTEETVEKYFFVSRNPLQAFLSTVLLLSLLLISCIRHRNPIMEMSWWVRRHPPQTSSSLES